MFNEAKNWFKLLRDDLVKNTQVFEKKSFIVKKNRNKPKPNNGMINR